MNFVYVSCSHNELFFLCIDCEGWGISPRGAGYLFGSDVVQQVHVQKWGIMDMQIMVDDLILLLP